MNGFYGLVGSDTNWVLWVVREDVCGFIRSDRMLPTALPVKSLEEGLELLRRNGDAWATSGYTELLEPSRMTKNLMSPLRVVFEDLKNQLAADRWI